MYKTVDEIVKAIVTCDDYKKCIELREQMKENKELIKLIDDIKKLQKKYVNTNDEKIKLELDELECKLNEVPIYVIYTQHLGRVNEKLSFIQEELNDYFYNTINN